MRMVKWVAVYILTGVLVLTACSGGGSAIQTSPAANHPHPTVPPAFAGMSNPLAGDSAAADAGSQLYKSYCATCHGESGMGDGPAAKSLNPPPLPLATEMDQIGDDYLYWRVSEGGGMAPFRSAMPAWKAILTEEQIWQIIAFLRTLS